ncbi:DUF4303 domain-containing protein [Phycisphaeraceae bacterium D3-23]
MTDELRQLLEEAMMQSCAHFLREHVSEHVYSVALFTSGDYRYVVASFSTQEGLGVVTQRYREYPEYRDETTESMMADLRWSPCDSPYQGVYDDHFARANKVIDELWNSTDEESDRDYINTCKHIHESCITVLNQVRTTGIFDKHDPVFNLLMGDQSEAALFVNAEAVNTPIRFAAFRKVLEVDPDELADFKATQWEW